MPPVELFVSTQKKSGLSVILQQRNEHKEERMLNRQSIHIIGAIIVNNHLPIMPSSQQLFTLPGSGQISETRFPQLQPPPIEPIRAVHVNSSSYVIHIIKNKRATVQQHRAAVIPSNSIDQFIRSNCFGPLQHQLPLQRVILGTGTGW